jgi:hypothetical protein
MNLCRADENCWSFNLNKNRKVCFLQTDAEYPSQRAATWSSGFRECVPSENNWDNPNTDAADDAVSDVAVDVATPGAAAFTYTAAANDAYYAATYVAILVADGGTCEDDPLYSVTGTATGATITGASTGPKGECLHAAVHEIPPRLPVAVRLTHPAPAPLQMLS